MDYFKIRADNIRALIQTKGWTYSQFAEATGIAATTVSRWFMRGEGRKNIGEQNARRIEIKLQLARLSLDTPRGEAKGTDKAIYLNEPIWPFSVSLEDFMDLEPEQQLEIGEIVEDRVARFKAKNGPRRRKKSFVQE